MATFSELPTTFDGVKQYLISKISEKYPTLGTYLENSFLVIFLDIIAWAIVLFIDYSQGLFDEGHLFSSKKYENARLIAQFYGHVAHRKISAVGQIRVGMNSDFNALPDENVTLLKHDAIQVNSTNYLINEAVTFSSNPLDTIYDGLPEGKYYIDVEVIQGQIITVNETAQGEQGEIFTVEDESIENSYFKVCVNGDEYTQVESFFLSTSVDKHYTIENLPSMAGVRLTFGDGYRGRKLIEGESLTFEYIKTDALDGQIKSTGFEVTFNETYQYADLTPVELYGENVAKLIGASYVESLESIKYYGQKAASALGEKAFNDDEIQIALVEFGGILKSKAISEYDISPDDPNEQFMNVVKLLIVPTSEETIDNFTKVRIRDYLRPKMDFTDLIQFIDVEYIDIYFKLDVDVFETTSRAISSNINGFLSSTYNLQNMDFGISLDHSEVCKGLHSYFPDDIKRIYLELWVTEELDPEEETGGELTHTLKLGNLVDRAINIERCELKVSFKHGDEDKEEIYITSMGVSPMADFTLQGGGSPLFLDAGTLNMKTGEAQLFISHLVQSITSVELEYIPYDTDDKVRNIDIKYFQLVRYKKSRANITYVS